MRHLKSLLFILAIAFVIVGFSSIVRAQSYSDCKQSCQADYDRVVASAQDTFNNDGFNEYTCSDLQASRDGVVSTCLFDAFGRPGGPTTGDAILGCFDKATDDAGTKACDATLQQCCLDKGKQNAQIWYNECMAGCPAPTSLCTGSTCGQTTCDGENLSTGGTCDENTGNCVGAVETHCTYGCNDTSLECNSAPPTCSNTCNPGESQLPYPDCTCVAAVCPEACGDGMTQKLYPDCGCVAKNLCINPDGSNKICNDFCDKGRVVVTKKTGKSIQTEFDHAIGGGTCNPDTGQCEYSINDTCTMGCAMNGSNSYCNEDCDNGKVDDQLTNLMDCANPSCASSIYCNCTKVGENMPYPGKKVLTILVGSTDFPETTPFYNYVNRDADAISAGQAVLNALKGAPPLNNLNYEVYVTRLPGQGTSIGVTKVYSVGYSSIRARCAATGGPTGDFVFFVDQTDSGFDSYSKLGSFTSTVFKNRMAAVDLPNVIVHEFGHGFGGLWDEYITNIVDIVKGEFMSSVNCAQVSTKEECQQYFADIISSADNIDCQLGCTSAQDWRSSTESVMNDPTTSGQYNAVDQVLMQQKIDAFYNAKTPPQWKQKSLGLSGWR